MTKAVLACASVFAAVLVIGPVMAAQQSPAPDDCETSIQKLDDSKAEGEERLAEKNDVIDACSRQYGRDKTITKLVEACAKYEEQPVIKQQFVADCQIAAFQYANALRELKTNYGK